MEAPEFIWLQWNGDGEADGSPVAESAVTWCQQQVFAGDERYIRVAEIAPFLEGVAANTTSPYDLWQWMKERNFI